MSEAAGSFITKIEKLFLNAPFLLALLAVSTVGYFYASQSEHIFWGLFGTYTLQFAAYWFLARGIKKNPNTPLSLFLFTAIVVRVILLFSDPILENDHWRYLWDGRVLAHGINPYQFAPLDPALDDISADYRYKIGWNQFRTIYPPMAQVFFAATHLIAADSLIGLKIMLLIFDLLTGFLLLQWLKEKNQDPRWSILYFLNPLVLKEIANSAHLDSIVVFFTFAAVYLFSQRRKPLLGWIVLSIATATKLYPLCLLPFFIKLDPKWRRHLSIYFACLALMYAPFLSAGLNLFGGTQAYAKYWIFNAGIFQVTTTGLNFLLKQIDLFSQSQLLREALKNDYPAKVLLGLVFLCGLRWFFMNLKRSEDLPKFCMWLLGLMLLLSPVVDAWYILWILPFACLLMDIPWLAFSYLVVMSYSWFFSKELAPFFRFGEYIAFFSIYIWWFRRQRLPKALNAQNVSSHISCIDKQ
ncbi:MAG: hypothetical protein AB7O96_17160 [Pseudobdellovibrionaceae bacterium]